MIAALTAKHGAPDRDFGWSAACPELDAGSPPNWRSISFGDLRLQFFRGNGPEVLDSWQYVPLFGASEEAETVDYADVVLHDGVEWFDPLADVAEALDSTVVTDELGFVYVPTATTTYEWSDYLGDAVFDSLNAGDSLVCE